MRLRLSAVIAFVGFVASAIGEAAGAAASPDPSSPLGAAPEMSAVLQEVTVTAQRLNLNWAERNALVQKAATFVYGIQDLEHYSGVPRWKSPVCPLVSGLPRQQGEFVLERISEIAGGAGIRLAGEPCQANLFIFVTTQPKDLLRAMENKHFAVSFGTATPSEVDEFIDTPRPIQVWHNTYRGGDGSSGIGLPPAAQILNGGLALPIYTTAGSDRLGANRLGDLSWAFGFTYAVVDSTQLRGVSLGQFADYVAMVTLAKIKPNAHFGDTPTILRLFDTTPEAAPSGMSRWDLTFLKILYHPELSLAKERSLIALRMVRELVPQ
jgi:hypothetical protein